MGKLSGVAAAIVLLGAAIAPPVGADSSSFAWSTADEFEGDAAYVVDVGLGPSFNDCEIIFEFAGFRLDPAVHDVDPVRWFVAQPHFGVGFAGERSDLARTAVGPVSIEHAESQGAFAWASRIQIRLQGAGTHQFSAAGLELAQVSGISFPGEEPTTQPAATLTVDCSDPVHVDALAVGRSVVGFSESSFRVANHESIVQAGLQAGSLEASFDTEDAMLAYRTLDRQAVSTTTVRLEHPQGTRTFHHVGLPTQEDRDLTQVFGQGGDWRMALTRAEAANRTSEIEGVFAGLDPASSLDELG